MITGAKKYFKGVLLACPILLIFLCVFQAILLARFNSHVYTVNGADDSSKTYMNFTGRGDSTSIWLKRDFLYKDEVVDLTGETVDGTLYNNSSDEISDWSMRINIKGDCYINNAWCGTVEIHQFVGTEDEKVQTLDLRNYKVEDVELEYTYDGDLLIPLQAGDYINYEPSKKDSEVPMNGNSELTTGFIFYYYETLDLSDYVLNYNYHRTLKQGEFFYVILVLLVIWIIGIIIYFVSKKIYEDAQKELELKKSGISSMSDLYDTIYIIDIIRNEIVSIVAEEESDLKRPEKLSADEQLRNLFEIDCVDAYKSLVLEFTDLSTLLDRMEGKSSIACEYISVNKGWCRLRFFAMDSNDSQSVDQVVFTIQGIDAEKREIDAAEERITKVERERREISSFFEHIQKEVMLPINHAIDLGQRIIDETPDENIKKLAVEARREAHKSKVLVSDVMEYSNLEAELIKKKETVYSIKEIFEGSKKLLEDDIDEEKIKFVKDIPVALPDKLYGDGAIIKDVLRIIIINSAAHMEEGTIKLSVFAKEYDDKIHILISVRDNGSDETLESGKLRIKLADGLLRLIDSELVTLRSSGSGNEAYFEVDQIVRSR